MKHVNRKMKISMIAAFNLLTKLIKLSDSLLQESVITDEQKKILESANKYSCELLKEIKQYVKIDMHALLTNKGKIKRKNKFVSFLNNKMTFVCTNIHLVQLQINMQKCRQEQSVMSEDKVEEKK